MIDTPSQDRADSGGMVERVARAMWETHPNHGEWDAASLYATPFQIYARAAIETMASGWQPIETAPRGLPLLVFSPEAREPGVFIAELNDFTCHETGETVTDWTDTWLEQGLDVEPIHWQPLPAPPNTPTDSIPQNTSPIGEGGLGAPARH